MADQIENWKDSSDPSKLTTNALEREVGQLKDLIVARVDGLEKGLEVRLNGMDKALVLLQARADKVPSETDIAVENLRKLHDEKFSSIAIQFKERDTRDERTQKDSKVAIDAALSAQKESVDKQNISNSLAIAKSETAFTKQIDAIGILIQTSIKATDDKINDTKERITIIESHSKGVGDSWGIVVGAAGIVIAAVAVAVAFLKP